MGSSSPFGGRLTISAAVAVCSLESLGCSGKVTTTKRNEITEFDGGATPSQGGAGSGGSEFGQSNGGAHTVGSGGNRFGQSNGGAQTVGSTSDSGARGTGGGSNVDYVCSSRPPRDPGGTGAPGTSCCGGLGTCRSPGDVAPKTSLGHDTCVATALCAPAPGTARAKCVSHAGTGDAAGLEGRCVDRCFLLGNPLAITFDGGGPPEVACISDEICAPCFNPTDGSSTGVCNEGSDLPSQPAPEPYAPCPADNDAGNPIGGGLCVPESALARLRDPHNPAYDPAIDASFKQDSCASGDKCVPARKALDPGFCAAHCTTSPTMQSIGAAYMAGACTPAFVMFDVAGTAGVTILTGGIGCPAEELCSPCQDPLNPGLPSGACY